jgi:hypothetical protein
MGTRGTRIRQQDFAGLPECLRRAVVIEEAGGAAVLALEVAREVGELLVTEVQGDKLDGFTGVEALIGDAEAVLAQPLAEGAAVGLAEVALDGAGGNATKERDFSGFELRAMSEGLPIDVLAGAAGEGQIEYRQMIGLNHIAAFRFITEHFTSSRDNKNKSGLGRRCEICLEKKSRMARFHGIYL